MSRDSSFNFYFLLCRIRPLRIPRSPFRTSFLKEYGEKFSLSQAERIALFIYHKGGLRHKAI